MEKNNSYQKIFNVQSELEAITKDSTNPYFKSKYFDVNAVIKALKPLLKKHRLIVLQPLSELENKSAIETVIMDTDNETILLKTLFPLPEITDPQKLGSAITYIRRYALVSLFLIEGEVDDDANLASNKKLTNSKLPPNGEPF